MVVKKRTAQSVMDAAIPAAAPAPHKSPASDVGEPRSKYTVLLGQSDLDIWDELTAKARRATGRRITRAELLRAMLALTADDESLQATLFGTLPGQPLD